MQPEFNTHAEAIIHTVFFFLSVLIDLPVSRNKYEVREISLVPDNKTRVTSLYFFCDTLSILDERKTGFIMLNPGEEIVGEYLKHIRRCDFVEYNLQLCASYR
jgi:hypothetical protein